MGALLWLSPLACSLSSEGRIQRRHVCVTSETRDRRRSFTDQFRRISRCAPRQRRQALKLEQEAVRLSALVGHRMACDMNLLLLLDQPRIGIILETAQPTPFRRTQPERREDAPNSDGGIQVTKLKAQVLRNSLRLSATALFSVGSPTVSLKAFGNP